MGSNDLDIDDLFKRLRKRPRVVESKPRKIRIWLWVILALIVVVLFSIRSLSNLYMTYLFYASVHHTNVFWTPFWTQVWLFFTGAILGGGMMILSSRSWVKAASSLDVHGAKWASRLRWIIIALVAVITGSVASSIWQDVLLWIHGHPFPTSDPYFHLNDGFFVYDLPFIDDCAGIAWMLLVLDGLVTGALWILLTAAEANPKDFPIQFIRPEGLTLEDGRGRLARHALVLLAVFFLLAAAGSYTGMFHLATSVNGDFIGLDATDRNVLQPMLVTCVVLALLGAIASIVLRFRAMHRSSHRVLLTIGGMVGAWLVVAGLLQFAPEAIYANVVVNPNAQQMQTPSINAFLTSSREAWGLEPGRDVSIRPFGSVHAPTLADLAADPGTLNNVRIVDATQLPAVLQQTERSRSYQNFPTITVDRYTLPDGTKEEVMIAPREIAEQDLPSQTFINQALHYTNGYGIVALSVNQTGQEGKPYELVGGQPQAAIAPASQVPPALLFNGNPKADPRIYCGLSTTQPVVVNTKEPEFIYPSGSGELTATGAGTGMNGISLTNPLTKFAASVSEFGGFNLFFTDQLTGKSLLLMHRQIQNRLNTIAPFVTLDSSPYIVADPATGHLMYIVDGYLTSNAFPESYQLGNGVSYMRNAVKAVIDAKTCQTTLYAVDPAEPLTATYEAIYPGIFRPLSALPPYLRSHLRYPKDLFRDQAQVYTTVHSQNAAVFFNRADFYQLSQEIVNGVQQATQSYYVEMTVPGASTNQFVLLQTFTPASNGSGGQANNMTAMLVATCNYMNTNHPKLVSIPLNNADNVLGPLQFDNNINTNPTISQQITLLGQHGSQVLLGNVIVLPFNTDSFLYVRPLYVIAQGGNGSSSFPQLQDVIVGTQNSVAMGSSFASALQQLFNTQTPIPGLNSVGVVTSPTPSPSPTIQTSGSPAPSPGTTSGGTVLTPKEQALLTDLLQNEAVAANAFKQGDFAAYGQAEAKVQSDAQQLQQLLGSAA